MTTQAAVSMQRASLSTALQNPNFRLYFVGQLASTSGTWMQNVAQGYLVFQITHSELWLGAVACMAGIPMLVLSPFAGVVVDRMSRRRVLLITQVLQMFLAFILAALTFSDRVEVWHIAILAFLLGMSNAFDAPARLSIVVELVGPESLPSGIALISIINSGSRILGPAAAGVALIQFGPAWCFFLNGVSFLAVIGSLLMLKIPYPMPFSRQQNPINQLKEGLRFVWNHEDIAPLMVLVAKSGFLGVPVLTIFPAYASEVLNSPDRGYALISVAQGVGSVIAGLLANRLAHRLGRGRLIVIMAFLAALASCLLSLQSTISTAALVSGLWGYLVVSQFVSLNTQVQALVPNAFRGRVLSLYTLGFLGLSPFGALLLGLIAEQVGTAESLAVYGVIDVFVTLYTIMRWRGIVRQP